MANSERKRRAKEMARLGWVWEPTWNAWVWTDYMATPVFSINYLPKTKQWGVIAHGEDKLSFSCPLAAAVWVSVEYADEQAEHNADRAEIERHNREGWTLEPRLI